MTLPKFKTSKSMITSNAFQQWTVVQAEVGRRLNRPFNVA